MITTVDNPYPPTGNANFLSARENPLSLNRLKRIRYRFAKHDWSWHLDRLRALGHRAAIVGNQGSGKTTLLGELGQQLGCADVTNQLFVLPPDSTRHRVLVQNAITCSENGSIVLVDGYERLNFIQRWQLLKQTRRGPGLIVAVHHACQLQTWIHCQTDCELMRSVVGDLGLNDPAIQAAARLTFENSGGNIRDALRDLYDQFAAGRFNHILSR